MDGRKSARRSTFRTGWVLDREGKAVTECVLREVSDTGARLELRHNVELPKNFTLALADQNTPRSCTTVWQLSIVAGVRFDNGRVPTLSGNI